MRSHRRVLIVAFSLAVQVAVAFLAVRLIRITNSSRAWIVIAVATLAMAVRRFVVLLGLLANPGTLDFIDPWSEAIGLVSAILMLLGIAAIAPLFRAVKQARETTQQAHDQLEMEVRRQTADLVRAHEELQTEFAQRAKAEESLRQQQRHLRQLLEMSERDQRLVAYEIHDGFIQPATAALMNLQAGIAALESDPQRAMENVACGQQLLRESISQVRWLISGLRPVVLEELGLVAAVDKLVHDTEERTGILIQWSSPDRFDRLSAPLETSLFRIVQEALRNAVRHSRGNRIEIALRQTGETVEARIQDWGCGFDASVQKPGHFGLEGMQERARLLGGAAGIQSRPGEGTCVTVLVPLSSEADART